VRPRRERWLEASALRGFCTPITRAELKTLEKLAGPFALRGDRVRGQLDALVVM
jgi:hypothetical protein